MAKYTPAPWHISNRSEFTVETLDGRSVATTGGYYDNKRVNEVHEENIANARLIAASPRLVDELDTSTSILESVLHLFGDSMAMSTKFGVTTQIEKNRELIKSIEG